MFKILVTILKQHMDHKYAQIYVSKMKWNLKTLHVAEFSGHFLLKSPMENNIGKCSWSCQGVKDYI